MSESELVSHWARARRDLVLSQLAPTALLGFTVWLMLNGLGEAETAVRIAAAGILLASGILGAVAQYSSASEGEAIGSQLGREGSSALASRIAASSRWLWIVKFVTPSVFIVIFGALLVALFA